LLGNGPIERRPQLTAEWAARSGEFTHHPSAGRGEDQAGQGGEREWDQCRDAGGVASWAPGFAARFGYYAPGRRSWKQQVLRSRPDAKKAVG